MIWPMNTGLLLTVSQAARYLGVSRWTLRRWLDGEASDMPRLTVAGLTRIPRPALDEWVAARTEWPRRRRAA